MKPEPPNKTGVQKTIIIFAAAITFIIAAVFIAGFIWWHTPPRFVVEADAGFKKAKSTIDPEVVRAWALECIQKNASRKEIANLMPESMRNLYGEPPDAWVDGSSLNLLWGGGFFHWGFYIGNTNETMPFNSENHEYPYNFEWRPGIYYTREAKWELQ